MRTLPAPFYKERVLFRKREARPTAKGTESQYVAKPCRPMGAREKKLSTKNLLSEECGFIAGPPPPNALERESVWFLLQGACFVTRRFVQSSESQLVQQLREIYTKRPIQQSSRIAQPTKRFVDGPTLCSKGTPTLAATDDNQWRALRAKITGKEKRKERVTK